MRPREYLLIGAAACGLAALATRVTPEALKILRKTREKISDAESIEPKPTTLPPFPRHFPRIDDVIESARTGDREALKFIVRYFEQQFQERAKSLRDGDKEGSEKLQQEIAGELGLSLQEFETLDAAHGIHLHLELIRGQGLEPFIQNMEDSGVQLMGETPKTIRNTLTGFKFFQILILLCEDVKRSGPYNPLLMRALEMEEDEFYDLVQEVYQYTTNDTPNKNVQQYIDYLKYYYQIP